MTESKRLFNDENRLSNLSGGCNQINFFSENHLIPSSTWTFILKIPKIFYSQAGELPAQNSKYPLTNPIVT